MQRILKILKKSMIVITIVFPKLKAVKDGVKDMHKKPVLYNTLQQSTYYRVPNTCEICTRTLLSFFSITLRETNLENVSLSVCEISSAFVNTVSLDDKYPL